MRGRAFRQIAAMLSVLLFASAPVNAGPVAISEVIQVIGSYQNPPDLLLRSISQTGSTPLAGINGPAQVRHSTDNADTSGVPSGSSDSLLSGVAVGTTGPQKGVEVITQGDVQGTICDCGDILVPAGGFPKWPLLFLAGIPFFFIDDDTPPPPEPPLIPTPSPPPPLTPIPEPASLLLFGSGLLAVGAGLRRRYSKAKLAAQAHRREDA